MPRRSRSRSNGVSLQAQVNRLTQMVQNMSTTRRSRSRRRRSQTPSSAIVQAPAATSRAISRGRSPAAGRGPNTLRPSSTGTIRITNREVFATIALPKEQATWGGSYTVSASTGSAFLSKLAALFGRYRWLSLDFEYESMVASSTDGVVAYGLDWGCTPITPAATGTTLAKVTSLNPSISHPLWQSNVRLPRPPSGRLNARAWYDTAATTPLEISSLATMWFYIASSAPESEKSFGTLWITYSVELQGPHV